MIYELNYKLNILSDDILLKRFNVIDIYQTMLYVKKHYGLYTKELIERHDWTDTVKEETKITGPIHPDTIKRLESDTCKWS